MERGRIRRKEGNGEKMGKNRYMREQTDEEERREGYLLKREMIRRREHMSKRKDKKER